MTPISVYSGIVSPREFQRVVFLSVLNRPQLWATDIGKTDLEDDTSKMVYIIEGPSW